MQQMSKKRKLKSFHEKELARRNKKYGYKGEKWMKANKWEEQPGWEKREQKLKRKFKKSVSKSKFKLKNPIIPVGMEYKDRHTWKKSK